MTWCDRCERADLRLLPESDHQRLFVDRIHEFAQIRFWNFEEVLECEHEVANADGQLGIFGFNSLENFASCRRVQTVHQIGEVLASGIRAPGLIASGTEAAVENSRSLCCGLWRELTHGRHAPDAVGSRIRFELHQQRRGLFRFEMAEDQSLSLCVLARQKI